MRPEEAVESYRRAVAANPLDMMAHRELNHLLYRLGRDEEFLRSYDDAAALYPEVAAAPAGQGEHAAARRGIRSARRESFNAAHPAPPRRRDAARRAGAACARMGRFDEAIREHETVVKMEPENGPAWRNFAYTLLRAGDPETRAPGRGRSAGARPDRSGRTRVLGHRAAHVSAMRARKG